MAADQERERATVKTYVSPAMKDEWVEHADELDMSQSEFVKAMVQAGRRKIDPGHEEAGSSAAADDTPGGSGSKELVLGLLDAESYLSWDELVERLTDDIEDRLDDALEELQAENRVVYSGRNGGYTLTEDA